MSYINQKNLSTKTEEWIKKIDPFNSHHFNINPKKTALLIIDMQKFFLNSNNSTFTESGLVILNNIQMLLTQFRKNNIPVIFTQHVHDEMGYDLGIMKWWWQDNCMTNNPEKDICDELKPIIGEKVIVKHRYSAFYNTDLEVTLRGMQIEDLVITGIMTNMCCESTARDAYFRDYRVSFLADATGSICEEMHYASLLNIAFGFGYVTTTSNIIKQI